MIAFTFFRQEHSSQCHNIHKLPNFLAIGIHGISFGVPQYQNVILPQGGHCLSADIDLFSGNYKYL